MNYGFIEPEIKTREQGAEHILGAVEDFGEVIKEDGDWEDFLPDKEPQKQYGVETQGCTVWGTLNALETLLYSKLGIRVNYSDRYLANMAKKYGKLDPYKGANPHDIAELIRKVTGLLREETCPWTPDLNTVEKYYGLTDELLDVFKADANRWYDTWELSHKWVFQDGTPEEKQAKLREALKRGTVCVSVNAWIPGEKFFIKPKGSSDNHWTMLAKSKETNTVFDSYDSYLKELDPLYDFGFAKIYYLTPAKPKLSLIQKIIDAITELLPFLKKQVEQKVEQQVEVKVVEPTPMPEVTPRISKLDKFCDAIELMEGAKKELNNPGNLRYTAFTATLGAIDKDSRGFCIFPDYATGKGALKQFVKLASEDKLKNYHDCTILSFFQVYAPAEDNNNPANYANFVAQKVNQNINDRLKDFI